MPFLRNILSTRASEQQTFGVEAIHKLPTYQLRTPSPKLLDALQIVERAGKITKKQFAEKATDNELDQCGRKG